jgi:hypothetical protein
MFDIQVTRKGESLNLSPDDFGCDAFGILDDGSGILWNGDTTMFIDKDVFDVSIIISKNVERIND